MGLVVRTRRGVGAVFVASLMLGAAIAVPGRSAVAAARRRRGGQRARGRDRGVGSGPGPQLGSRREPDRHPVDSRRSRRCHADDAVVPVRCCGARSHVGGRSRAEHLRECHHDAVQRSRPAARRDRGGQRPPALRPGSEWTSLQPHPRDRPIRDDHVRSPGPRGVRHERGSRRHRRDLQPVHHVLVVGRPRHGVQLRRRLVCDLARSPRAVHDDVRTQRWRLRRDAGHPAGRSCAATGGRGVLRLQR